MQIKSNIPINFYLCLLQKTTAALTSGGGGYKNIMKNTSPFGGFAMVCII